MTTGRRENDNSYSCRSDDSGLCPLLGSHLGRGDGRRRDHVDCRLLAQAHQAVAAHPLVAVTPAFDEGPLAETSKGPVAKPTAVGFSFVSGAFLGVLGVLPSVLFFLVMRKRETDTAGQRQLAGRMVLGFAIGVAVAVAFDMFVRCHAGCARGGDRGGDRGRDWLSDDALVLPGVGRGPNVLSRRARRVRSSARMPLQRRPAPPGAAGDPSRESRRRTSAEVPVRSLRRPNGGRRRRAGSRAELAKTLVQQRELAFFASVARRSRRPAICQSRIDWLNLLVP